jgi:hypothetical protein
MVSILPEIITLEKKWVTVQKSKSLEGEISKTMDQESNVLDLTNSMYGGTFL